MPNSEFIQIKRELVDEVKGMHDEIKGMRQDMNIILKTVDVHDKVLFGDKFKEPGMTEDVRNLRRLAGVVVTSCTGVVGLFGEFVFRTFFHHPKGG